jgi:hypothetical protein
MSSSSFAENLEFQNPLKPSRAQRTVNVKCSWSWALCSVLIQMYVTVALFGQRKWLLSDLMAAFTYDIFRAGFSIVSPLEQTDNCIYHMIKI